MIKIFIESGINAAQKKNKETTNEQDFIIKVIAKHFPKCQYGKDYEIVGAGGWKNLSNLVFEFESNNDTGGKNLVIFDADEKRNDGGFTKRQAEILALKSDIIQFDLFLWPDNQNDGDFELLLSKIVNPEHLCLLNCYEHFENEVKSYDPNDEKYDVPGRKGEMYTYISLHKKSNTQEKSFKKGYWLFDDTKYWDLSNKNLNPLVEFLGKYFEEWR